MHFKDQNGGLHFLSDEDIANGGMALLPAGCVEISDEAAHAIQNPPLTLDQAKAVQLANVAAAFAAASTLPVTDGAGLTWSGGFDSAQKIYGAAQLAQAGGATSLTIYDASNIGHSLTIAQATEVAAEVGVAYQTAFAKYQGLKVAIAAATTVAAVQAITWS